MTIIETKGNKRMLIGLVISNKNDKTIIVRVEMLIKHPLYKKYITRHKKFMAHDQNNICRIGDKVQIIEYRRLSTRKCWYLNKIIKKAI